MLYLSCNIFFTKVPIPNRDLQTLDKVAQFYYANEISADYFHTLAEDQVSEKNTLRHTHEKNT